MGPANFLLARVRDDERIASSAAFEDRPIRFTEDVFHWTANGTEITTESGYPIGRVWSAEEADLPTAQHIAHWDPARVLAWCEKFEPSSPMSDISILT